MAVPACEAYSTGCVRKLHLVFAFYGVVQPTTNQVVSSQTQHTDWITITGSFAIIYFGFFLIAFWKPGLWTVMLFNWDSLELFVPLWPQPWRRNSEVKTRIRLPRTNSTAAVSFLLCLLFGWLFVGLFVYLFDRGLLLPGQKHYRAWLFTPKCSFLFFACLFIHDFKDAGRCCVFLCARLELFREVSEQPVPHYTQCSRVMIFAKVSKKFVREYGALWWNWIYGFHIVRVPVTHLPLTGIRN